MTRGHLIAAAALSVALATGAVAEETALSLELNALDARDGACRITFLARNDGADDIEQAVFEAVIFDTEGRVERLTLFDVQSLPVGRPRVRQFDLAGLACGDIGRLLINGTTTCTVGGAESDACALPVLSSRADVDLIG